MHKLTLPPYALFLGIEVDSMREGSPVLACSFSPAVMGRPGFLHGGALSGLLEMAAIAALQAQIERDEPNLTLKPVNITIDFMRGGRQKRTYAMGNVTRLGRRVANVEVYAWQDNEEKPIGKAFMNFRMGQNQESA